MSLRVGSGLPNIQRADIETLEIQFPAYQQQRGIGRYLNTLREEIAVVSVYTETLNTQKRGLMQKLLTGQWRIKTPSTEAT